MNYDTLILFSVVSFFYIISPGPAIFLAIYNGAVNGVKCVSVSALGNILGLLILSALSISGLSAVLMASSSLFMAFKIVGALYLIYLGIKQIRASKEAKIEHPDEIVKSARPLFSYFKEGLLVAVTNPKPIVFFAALFPQFLDTKSPLLMQFSVMTLIFMAFSFLSLSTYGYLGRQAKEFLSGSHQTKWFHRISGGLFVGMGVSLFHVKSAS
ncbi:lysine transporter LysE [Veronia nyctiphanis]|uniref:Lysine transporter LysE n=1 Tax=Veronia nyctiphanis TaxID=1278244 RepID=A0A4Q0YMZ2_9GAMM|nr:LysE family translocator [Veronia nyctiphanis]RXJ71813.1 lysine transporter LysE [Veronia nyctiphanis]